jgi:CheY-like chemotaxis protein/HPt (histidine-containing phosphotransfer) domain-containing protein
LVIAPLTPAELVVDATRFRQVLLNLLGNAVKFTEVGNIELRMQSAADGRALRIEVRDTGRGISPQQRARLFQDFERLDSPGKIEGAGLGLALSSRLVALLGGRLGHLDNPAGGSVFWLELPTTTARAELATEVEPMTQPAPSGKLKVLVVDDVLMNRDIAASFLQAAGHEVQCVESGAEAITAIAGADFDVVLMDVRMPEMDGLEAARHVRALPGLRGQVPIVGLTAYAFSEQVSQCHEAGMNAHLAKPFAPEMLFAAVARAVEAGRRLSVQSSLEPLPVEQPPVAVTGPTLTEPHADSQGVAESRWPVLDVAVMQTTSAALNSEMVAAYLRKLSELGQSLLHELRDQMAAPNDLNALAAAAHKLAGSAGMFGFVQLAHSGLSFEQAATHNRAEIPARAMELCTAIEHAIEEINHLG